jgi:hypothetical protein
MDTTSAAALGKANRGSRERVFDWDTAARKIKEVKPGVASAGLQSDWEWTGGDIYRDGNPVPREDTYTYLCSNWAIPELSMDDEIEECWIWIDESPNWGSDTYWPASAISILHES